MPDAASAECGEVDQECFGPGLHAARHAVLNVLPLHVMCSSSDMKTECDSSQGGRYRLQRILLYDAHPGGLGFCGKVREAQCFFFQK